MGGSWLPDPSIGSSKNEISEPPVHIIESDSDDAEIVENNLGGISYYEYHLLSDGDNLAESEGLHQPDDHSEEIEETNQILVPDEFLEGPSDEAEVQTLPRDIIIDCDQVRAAMAQVTLPASATPSWAASIPDSEWHSFLQNRIRSLQNGTQKESE